MTTRVPTRGALDPLRFRFRARASTRPACPSIAAVTTAVGALMATFGPARALAADNAAPSAAEPAASKDPSTAPRALPLVKQPEFWSPDARFLRFRCRDMKLEARSRLSPSTSYGLSQGPFSEKDCKVAVASLESSGCFCDDGTLRCLETAEVRRVGVDCPSRFFCFPFRNDDVGLISLKTVGNYYTHKACERELEDLDRG